jgi:1A family penicillin-binding protein
MALEKHKHLFHKHRAQVQHRTKTTWGWIRHNMTLIFWVGLTIATVLLGILIIWMATLKVPTIATFADRKISSSTKIYDRTGTVVLYDVHEDVKRTVVDSAAISPKIKQAIVAIEDKDFYKHHGIKISSIIRAGFSQIIPLSQQSGGSTITQQLIKNTLLTQQKSISRKVKEWVLAIKLERVMTKDQILTTYLNEAPYGGQTYGVEEAAQSFFGKKSADVDLAEAAYLAAIPNRPSYYSPYGKNRPNLNARKNLVLKNMLDQGYINQTEYDQARNEVVTFKPREDTTGKAIHFVEYVRQYLEEKYGTESVMSQGLKVTTTLDWDLQQVAEKTIKENALKNEQEYNASNSALVAIDPKTGQILSMVGSRDYSDRTIDGAFNVATAGRQPGSSFKPIVYSRAFEKGFEPETAIFDVPTQFGTGSDCPALSTKDTAPCYAPSNYDNKFLGPISLRNALAQSRNIPAVKMLWLVGLSDALATAKKLGITTLDRTGDRYGLTLVLGGGEVSLLDMTSVYSVFANDGVRNPVTGILKVEDLQGNTLEEYTPQPETVMDYNAVRKLSSVLSDNVARTPLFGSNSFFYFGGRQVAGKTGTTNDNKDAWVFGYTPSIAVGVWSGNNDNKPMKKGSAISGPAWRAFMDAALAKLPEESFPAPDPDPHYYDGAPVLRGGWAGGQSFVVDTISGKLATSLTPNETKKEYVIPNPHSILYWINPSNPRGPKPSDPSDNSQFNHWEASVQNWLAQHPGIVPGYPTPPTGYDDVHTEANKPTATLVSPQTSMPLPLDGPSSIQLGISSHFPLKSLTYYLNDHFVGTSTTPTFTIDPSDVDLGAGVATLRVLITDTAYNKGEFETTLSFQ